MVAFADRRPSSNDRHLCSQIQYACHFLSNPFRLYDTERHSLVQVRCADHNTDKYDEGYFMRDHAMDLGLLVVC
jgi:hypothetical protein